MSGPSSPSLPSAQPSISLRSLKPTTVKISHTVSHTVLAQASGTNLARAAGMQATSSKMNLHRKPSNYFIDTMERFQLRSTALRVDSQTMCYEKLKVSTSQQYFRDDWGGVTAIRYSQDGERLAVGFNSGELLISAPPFCSPLRAAPSETVVRGWEGNDCISCVRFHPKKPQLVFASSTDGSVLRRDLEDDYNDVFIKEQNNEIYSMDFTSNCDLVTVGRDGTVRLYNVVVDKVLHEFGRVNIYSSKDSLSGSSGVTQSQGSSQNTSELLPFHEKRVHCVRCHPTDPAVVVTGGWDGIRVWDIRLGVPVRNIDGPFIFGDTVDLCKGTILSASCEAEDTLQLWDIGSGFLLEDVVPSNKRVYLYGEYPYVAQFFKGDPSGDMILYGVGGLQVISHKESSILYLIEDERPVIAVDSTDKKVSFGGKSNIVMNCKLAFPETDVASNNFSMSRTVSSCSVQFSEDTIGSRAIQSDKSEIGSEKSESEKIGSGKIGSEKIGSDKIGSEKIGSEKIGSEKIGSGKIGSEKIESEKNGSEKNGSDKNGSEKIGSKK